MSGRGSIGKRALGSGGIAVSPIGLGCMSLSGGNRPDNDANGIAVIHEALDRGITLLDTSDLYGAGHNEQLVGKAIKGRRSSVVLATKFGNLGSTSKRIADGRPEYVARACEASLKRLGIETIDLYYLHRIDPTVPIEDTVGAMGRLVEQGKVRALGLSEARPETIRRAHRTHTIAAVQNEFSLLYRAEAMETLPTTRQLGIAFVAYAPLSRGLLTMSSAGSGPIAGADMYRKHPRFAPDNLGHNLELVGRLDAIARGKGCTSGQLVLAWLLAQGDDVIPIPGTKRIDRLLENLGALSVALTDRDLTLISEAIPVGSAAGLRYPEAQMSSLYL